MAGTPSRKAGRRGRTQSGQEGDPASHLVHGDNLPALKALHDRGTRAALVYLDPPFFTGREHAQVNRQKSVDGSIERELVPAFEGLEPAGVLRLRRRVAGEQERESDQRRPRPGAGGPLPPDPACFAPL